MIIDLWNGPRMKFRTSCFQVWINGIFTNSSSYVQSFLQIVKFQSNQWSTIQHQYHDYCLVQKVRKIFRIYDIMIYYTVPNTSLTSTDANSQESAGKLQAKNTTIGVFKNNELKS